MDIKKRVLLIALVFAICFLFSSTFVLGAVSDVPSRITVETRIVVNSSLFGGLTTNFSGMSNSQLRNITGMTLEKPEHGKIVFQASVDLTDDSLGGIVDIDGNVNISDNHIEINTDELTSLEKPAMLYLYSLNFSNPRIMRNGEVCPDSACQKINYSSGVLAFSVSSFTSYSAEETPPAAETPKAVSGGGGGGLSPAVLALDKSLIKLDLKQGETKRETLEIVNAGKTAASVSIEYPELEKFLIIDEVSFTLNPGEARTLNLDFFSREDEIPDAYSGRIVVKSRSVSKVVNVILEVREKKPLFDMITDVQNSEVFPRGKVRAEMTLTNMGDLRNIDVHVYYAVRNFAGRVISSKEESLAINQKATITRELDAPGSYGDYIFYARLSYGNISAASASAFSVVKEETPMFSPGYAINTALSVCALIIGLVILVVFVLYLRKQGRLEKERDARKQQKSEKEKPKVELYWD